MSTTCPIESFNEEWLESTIDTLNHYDMCHPDLPSMMSNNSSHDLNHNINLIRDRLSFDRTELLDQCGGSIISRFPNSLIGVDLVTMIIKMMKSSVKIRAITDHHLRRLRTPSLLTEGMGLQFISREYWITVMSFELLKVISIIIFNNSTLTKMIITMIKLIHYETDGEGDNNHLKEFYRCTITEWLSRQ